jgi:hypothetical protein
LVRLIDNRAVARWLSSVPHPCTEAQVLHFRRRAAVKAHAANQAVDLLQRGRANVDRARAARSRNRPSAALCRGGNGYGREAIAAILVLALTRGCRLFEEVLAFRYAIWCAGSHHFTVVHTAYGVKLELSHQA